ncbi:hypothetical protein W97_08242 [Coniosporium apollinis CBS 100218]|uniref:Major facilitator superfamily (MFS) profile domain-containing protein n=1 Tax=Coniosporium apollinis (strain CBS 100218) TaxID=1168221 RepID=R7Z4N7_CONA1|nr:uncharacterized protein W97_08242 [Coniosporium apollinis CBS 100218]EON68984.1 hypothetical protein W97_08242 [Coniosporium apollinis CBS 100218]
MSSVTTRKSTWQSTLAWLSQDFAEGSSPPFLLKYRSSKWLILTTICMAVFTDIFLYGLIVPVIPFALEQRSGVPPQRTQYWVSLLIAIYGAALITFSPVCGYLADRSTSRRLPLIVGLLALAGATVMLNVGNSIAALVTGRVLQGVSAAVVWVVGLALLADTVGKEAIGQAMGWVGMSMSLGILASPLLGGVVYDRAGYNAVFAMAYVLIGVDILLRLVMVERKIAVRWLPEEEEGGKEKGDVEGGVATPPPRDRDVASSPERAETEKEQPGAVIAPTTTTRTDSHSDAAPPTQRRATLPPVLSLLASRRLLAALWGCLAQATLMTCFDSVLPLHVHETFGWTSLGAGLIFLPITIPSFLAPLAGWISDRYGPRWPATAGFILAAPCFVCLRFVTASSLQTKVLLCALLAVLGLALASAMPPLMAEITYVVQAKERKRPGSFGERGAYAQAYGLFNMAFAGGCLVGPIWAGLVRERAGWGTMGWSLGALSAVSAVPVAVWVGGFIGGKGERVKGRGKGS